ncbi:DUF6049 family protein [Cellulomonas triticagri]|uniref:Uncharacterized protein n=1 Tax=Cellulomonas triticagri TaxID=2483352 RepID=A0A3M2JC54_9CELL|nr:DUF6049 family protein [Cellulomonas triticagri]RMI09093.1 hypothetical protein EBM89_11710 [Cellulomonas triticagri]
MRLRGTVRRAGAVAATVVVAGVLALVGQPAAGATPAAVPAAPSTDSLPVTASVTQVSPQVLEPGQDLTVTATLRNDGTRAIEQPRASVRIYRYRMSSRDEVAAWATAGTTSPIGDVAATTVLDTPLEPGASTTVTVTVPADDIGLLRTDEAWGPRGITLDVGDGRQRVGVDRTFLLWASADEVPTAQVGVVAPVVGPATVPVADEEAEPEESPAPTPAPTSSAAPTPEGDVSGEAAPDGEAAGDEVMPSAGTSDGGESEVDAALTALTASGGRLGRLLQATGDLPFVSWAVDPAVVDQAAAGSRAAQTWLSSFTDAADGREVLRLPWADADVAAIAHAGEADPDADLLDLALGVTSAQQSSALWSGALPVLWAADDTTDQVTAARAATSAPGVPLVLAPGSVPADGSDAPSSPTTLSTSGGSVTAIVPDETLSDLLADPAGAQPGVTAATAAQRVLAETAVLARSDDAASTYLVATTPRDWSPSTSIATAQLRALDAAPWVDTRDVAEVVAAQTAGQASGDGATRSALPDAERDEPELTPAWVNALSASWRAAREFAAVVDDPDALLAGLDADLVTPLSVAWRSDPDGRAAAVDQALALAQGRQGGLSVLLNEQFTVISSSAQITVVVRNELDQDAHVRVELRPRKGCLDTARSELQSARAGADTPVQITVEANANCDVQVDVSLVSESGRDVAGTVTFAARVAPTIESVGSVVVGVLLALALAFGIWRTVRRGQTNRRGAKVVPDADPDADPDLPDADDAARHDGSGRPDDAAPPGRQDP